jgi:hypothetical protein
VDTRVFAAERGDVANRGDPMRARLENAKRKPKSSLPTPNGKEADATPGGVRLSRLCAYSFL